MNGSRRMLLALGLSAGLFAASGISALAMQAGREVPRSAKIGQKAPAFMLKDIKGATHDLAKYAGKILVMEWVNPQCPVCRGAHVDGRIPKMVKELNIVGNVQFLAVCSNPNVSPQEHQEALKSYNVEYPLLLDSDTSAAQLFGAKTTPHVFVIDADGILRYHGALDNDADGTLTKEGKEVTNYVLQAVRQVKADETVSPDHVRPYGCKVRYQGENSTPGGNREQDKPDDEEDKSEPQAPDPDQR